MTKSQPSFTSKWRATMKLHNEKGALLHAPIPKLRLRAAYHLLRLPQVQRAVIRRCIACDARVNNRNLGGNNGRSALTGDLYCERCADWPHQLMLPFGHC